MGREQAAITAQRISKLAADDAAIDDHYGRRPIHLVRLVHSGVTRAAQTAAIIAEALPPHVSVEVVTSRGLPMHTRPLQSAGLRTVISLNQFFWILRILTQASRCSHRHQLCMRSLPV
jgi:phosphohistidine phosphatase SixA